MDESAAVVMIVTQGKRCNLHESVHEHVPICGKERREDKIASSVLSNFKDTYRSASTALTYVDLVIALRLIHVHELRRKDFFKGKLYYVIDNLK